MIFPIKQKIKILSLGAESVGRFCFYDNSSIFMSPIFGDILDFSNFKSYEKAVLAYIKSDKPDLVVTDLHPLYNSTIFGEELSKKLKIPHLKVQHHLAHIFSAVGDDALLRPSTFSFPPAIYGIAMDGTGYGLDGNIWGGEVFKCQMSDVRCQIRSIERIGSLEEQTMIGGDLAVREPARMLIAILIKLKNENEKLKTKDKNAVATKTKDNIYHYVNKYYNRNEFELLYNQLEQNFNCQKTTSTGRILDAVSVLLEFAGNKRNFKHEAAKFLEKNSTVPYGDIEPKFAHSGSRTVLNTTHLFKYLLENIQKDKKRLAATAQLYVAKGLYEIVRTDLNTEYYIRNTYLAGGIASNKIISEYLGNKDVYLSKTIPRGDEGIAFGQLSYLLYNKTKKPYPMLTG